MARGALARHKSDSTSSVIGPAKPVDFTASTKRSRGRSPSPGISRRQRLSVIGSLVGTRNDLADCFALHARGETRVVAEARRLEDVNACFDEVLAGQVPARLVFDMRHA